MSLVGKLASGVALAGFLGVAGCNLERDKDVRVEMVDQSSAFASLWKNPKDAVLGMYKERIMPDLEKLMKESEGRAGEDYGTRDDDGAYHSDLSEASGRGYKLADNLLKNLKGRDCKKENLLIVSVGAAHSYALGTRLQDKWNVHFYAEPSFVEKFEEFTREANFDSTFSQFFGKKDFESKNSSEKPNTIVYGDNHEEADTGFTGFFPSFHELKRAGIRKIIYVKEDLIPKRGMSVARVRSIVNFETHAPFLDYLDGARKAGIDVEVMGMADHTGYLVGDETK